MISDVTPELGLPLPHPANDLADDVGRLRAALGAIDTLMATFDASKASLVDGKVPAGQLPGFVDDVIEVADVASFPAVGESGKIYVAVNSPPTVPSRQYRWGGSTYTEINPSPGSTDAVPEGVANLYFSVARARAAMQVATNSQLGLVKIGNGLSVDAEGVVSINGSLMAFTVVPLSITSNGQTAFTVTGGYTAGAIQVLLNGVELASDDYTASDGTTVVLASDIPITTLHTLWVRRWKTFEVADAVTISSKVSQADMEAGVSDVVGAMSPLLVKQAIAALAPPPAPAFSAGDLLTTTRALTAPGWLPADGAVYLQSSYASLFASVGLSNFFDPGAKLTNPATLPVGNGSGCAFSPDGTYLAVSHLSSPFVTIYKRSGDIFTKLTNPATLPAGAGRGCAFSNDGVYLSVAHDTSPYITIYKRSGDTFTKLTNPATLPSGNGSGCAFSVDGVYLSVVHSASPFVTIYKRSGDVFTKLTDPATLPSGTARGCAFSVDGVYLSVVHSTSPYITIYKRSGDTFTKLTNPVELPAGDAYGCAFSPDGVHLCVAHSVAPYMTIYKRNGDVSTKLDNPAFLPISGGVACSFSPDGNYLCVSHSGGLPYFVVYRRSGDAFLKQENPATLPNAGGNGCAFSPDSSYLSVAHDATPFVTIYGVGYDKTTQFKLPNLRRLGINAFIKT